MSNDWHKRYWQRFLLPDEQVIHTFGVSRWYIIMFWLVPATMLSGLALYAGLINYVLGLLVGIVALSVLLPAVYLKYFVHYAITDYRVMTREGLLHKKFVTADLPSVTDVTINESFLERILTRTGVVGINTAGSHYIEVNFKHVRKPFVLRRDIYQHQYKVIEERKLEVLQKNGYTRTGFKTSA